MREINNTFGTLSSAPDNTIINKIYSYLSTTLIGFRGEKDDNENAITNKLCKTLNSRKPPEYPFYFHHQNIEDDKENTSTDFAVFGTYAYAQENNIEDDSPSLIKFEAKRLNSKLPKKREKEYVCGQYLNNKCVTNSGGIERFKNGRHGKDVVHAGIIGYIQTDSPKYWIQKVNNWIQEQIENASDDRLTWLQNDLLIINSENETLTSYSSISYRVYDDNIQLKHFWIDFSKQQN